ncbi:MAG: LysM peptidoglycan-binding domain-containing protein [Dokdonella sp.]
MSAIAAVNHANAYSASSGGNEHVVQHGDTLSAIAAQNGVSLHDLIAANPEIRNPDLIYPGDRIAIPTGGHAAAAHAGAAAAAGNYSVRSGDTLSGIAAQHGVSLSSLLAANPQISNPDLIYPGQNVHIPAGGSGNGSGRTSETGATTSSGPVKGSNAAAIAEQFNGENTSTLKASHALPMNPNTPNDSSCANFVSACLQQAGLLSGGEHTDSVATLNRELRDKGWHAVSIADAKPGDVVIIQGGGASHTEIVASNDHGHITLIGSNNTNADDSQRIGHDSSSWAWNHGGVILAPP